MRARGSNTARAKIELMSLTLAPMPVPLREEPDGSIRVGGSRMLLEVFVTIYARDGVSAAEMIEYYPSISPADVHLTIAYYEAHRAEVDAYLEERAAAWDVWQADFERDHPEQRQFWERLESRLAPDSRAAAGE